MPVHLNLICASEARDSMEPGIGALVALPSLSRHISEHGVERGRPTARKQKGNHHDQQPHYGTETEGTNQKSVLERFRISSKDSSIYPCIATACGRQLGVIGSDR